MSSSRTLAFDLDGTLVDSAPDLLASLNFVLGEAGLAPMEASRVRSLVGGGARLMIERGLAFHGVRKTESEVDRMLADFLRFYEGHIADHSRPFPGAAATLDLLASQGAKLIVVTNKIERYATQLLEILGLDSRFLLIAGPDTFGVRKPDPGHLLRAVEQAGGLRSSTVMIGDSSTDVSTARAARVPVVAVSFGYSEIAPHDLGADHVIDRLDELPSVLSRLPAAG